MKKKKKIKKTKMKMKIIMFLMIVIFMYGSRYYFDVTSQAVFPPAYLYYGSVGLGDFNGDGLIDFLVGGSTSASSYNFYLFKQNRSLSFYDITNGATFPVGVPSGFSDGRVLFVDVNGDGALDVFYTGLIFVGVGLTNVYLQDGASSTFSLGNSVSFPGGLPQSGSSYADFADADGDGWMDLLLIGSNILFCLFRQNASLLYTNVTNVVSFPAGFPPAGLASSWTAWRDYDGDGLSDFALIGYYFASMLYRQNSTFKFYNA